MISCLFYFTLIFLESCSKLFFSYLISMLLMTSLLWVRSLLCWFSSCFFHRSHWSLLLCRDTFSLYFFVLLLKNKKCLLPPTFPHILPYHVLSSHLPPFTVTFLESLEFMHCVPFLTLCVMLLPPKSEMMPVLTSLLKLLLIAVLSEFTV